MEVQVEADGTWFREQEDWRHTEGIKLSNQDAREIMERFMEAQRKVVKDD